MLRRMATRAEDQLRHARELLALVRDALVEFGATEDDRSALAASIRQVEELFLLVAVGEFNAGKSAFINADRPTCTERRRAAARAREDVSAPYGAGSGTFGRCSGVTPSPGGTSLIR